MCRSLKLRLRRTDHETTEQLTIDEADFPLLFGLLGGARHDDLEDELSRLLSRYWHPRSERWPTNALARVLYIGDDARLHTEPSIIEDISLSGIRLAIKRKTNIELMALSAARVQVVGTFDGSEEVLDIPSWMVRVAAVGEDSVSIAFRYAKLEPDQACLLERLRAARDF